MPEFNTYQKLYTFLLMKTDMSLSERVSAFLLLMRMNEVEIENYLSSYDFNADEYTDFYDEINRSFIPFMATIDLINEENNYGSQR